MALFCHNYAILSSWPTTKGGTIWSTIVTIHGGMQAIGYGLLVLFFTISLFRSAASFWDFQRPEYVVRHLIQFVLAAVGLYALLSRFMGRESVSWICILGAAPFAVAGFFQYNGMKLEKFAWVWFKSCFLLSNHRVWRSENRYIPKTTQQEGKKN